MKIHNAIRLMIWFCLCTFSMLVTTGCGKSERVHESWVQPAEKLPYEDSAILSNIKARLAADPNLKNLILNIEVRNGEVSIIGLVDNPSQVDQVIMQTWLVEGVKKVDNQIRTKGSQ